MRLAVKTWSEAEKEIFAEKYLQVWSETETDFLAEKYLRVQGCLSPYG